MEVRPLARQSLAYGAYQVLRRMIVEGKFRPGEKIIEARAADTLGISRTPVREALQRLEVEGLVRTRVGKSTRVTSPTPEQLEEMYVLIAVLEGLAARLAVPRLTISDLNYMEELTRKMAQDARQGNVRELIATDNKFHGVIHGASRNGRLQKILRELHIQVERYEYTFFSSPRALRASLGRHRNLVRIFRQRDPEAAQRALEGQWDQGRQALQRMLEKQPSESGAPATDQETSRPGPEARPTRGTASKGSTRTIRGPDSGKRSERLNQGEAS
jgi:DNA-binding GntR family transcriptional regulator